LEVFADLDAVELAGAIPADLIRVTDGSVRGHGCFTFAVFLTIFPEKYGVPFIVPA
jgi:hypothetical protein